MAATDNRLTPTLPYLKNGTITQRKRVSTQTGLINLNESNGSTDTQKIKSATDKLKQVKKTTN